MAALFPAFNDGHNDKMKPFSATELKVLIIFMTHIHIYLNLSADNILFDLSFLICDVHLSE